jgi:hypothetical protein
MGCANSSMLKVSPTDVGDDNISIDDNYETVYTAEYVSYFSDNIKSPTICSYTTHSTVLSHVNSGKSILDKPDVLGNTPLILASSMDDINDIIYLVH